MKTIDKDGNAIEYSNNMYSSSMMIGMTYNIIDGPFTPYISGNIGATFADTGILVVFIKQQRQVQSSHMGEV